MTTKLLNDNGNTVIATRRPMSCLLYVVVDLDVQRGGTPDGHGQHEHAEPDKHVPEGHRIVGWQVAEQRGGGGARDVQQGGQLSGEHDSDGIRANQHRYDDGQHDNDGQQASADERELRRRLCRVRVHVAGRRQLDSSERQWMQDDRTCHGINNVEMLKGRRRTDNNFRSAWRRRRQWTIDGERARRGPLRCRRPSRRDRAELCGRWRVRSTRRSPSFAGPSVPLHISVLIVYIFQVADCKTVCDLGQGLWYKIHKITKFKLFF